MRNSRNIIIIYLLLTSTICFSQQKQINVLDIGKSEIVNKESNSTLVDACSSWLLSEEEATIFFQKCTRISAFEKNNSYYHMPCEIRGTVEINDTIFNFSINAGASAILFYENTTYFYGCSDTTCNKFVLMPPDINE